MQMMVFMPEGYTGAVVHVLARRWSDLPQLQRLVSRDAAFRTFVYLHVDGTAQTKDLQLVLHNAKAECFVTLRRLCSDIAARAQRALDQQRRLGFSR
jgi:hypothetical protein